MPPAAAMRFHSARLQYLLLAGVILGSLTFYLASAAALFDNFIHYDERAALLFDFAQDPVWTLKPHDEAYLAGIRPGDTILSINNVPFTGEAEVIEQAYNARVGQTFDVHYRTPAGHLRQAYVPLTSTWPKRPGPFQWFVPIAVILLFPAFCLFLGYWVVLSKPRDWNAWLFLSIMNVVPAFVGVTGYFPGFLATFTILWHSFAINSMFVSLTLLGIYFPVRSRLDARHPWVKWVLLIPQILIIPGAILLSYGQLYHISSIEAHIPAINFLRSAGGVFETLALVVFIAAIVRKLFTVPAADARRRLGVIAAGSLLGLSPVLIFLVVSTFPVRHIAELAHRWTIFALVLLFPLFPLSLAYTVIVQRALDVRIFLRQGTRYALARGTLWVIQVAVLVYLGYQLLRFTRESSRHDVHLFLPVVFVLVVIFLRVRVARTLTLWLDRRFFREAYSAEQVLSELSEQARTFTSTGPLVRTIIDRISETLHIKSVAALLRSGDEFRLKYQHGLPEALDLSLPANTSTIRALARNTGPVRLNPDNPDPWMALANPAEIALLNQLHAVLVLPLPGRTKLTGIMTLGPKLSEEPYSSSDRRLLQSVALQTGLAIENSELIHHLAEEEAHRERMNREIEIAQEVQERLFPQVYPEVEGVELAGFCRTAQQIGGDYYDFIALENGRLGIAVGDISGKGISAALLMASMRAGLRGLTLSGTLDLAGILQRMNLISYDSSTSNRFATFFFAEYDRQTRRLNYVNAGHNPPVLLKPSSTSSNGHGAPGRRYEVKRLEIGGPVMGVFPEVQYEQGQIAIEPEDVLIAFTDGLSEAMTADYEEWGEERLIEAAQKCAHLPAREIASCMVEEADSFTAGAPQQDDLTMVVVKFC